MNRKLRMGMIGGGKDAFIGAIHRHAALLDGNIELVCGALSIRPEVAVDSGRALFFSPDRIYTSYEEMLEKEALLPEGLRMDFVSIVTPNFAHFAPAMLALEKGFHVVIEKPITLSLEQAVALENKVKETGLILCLTHTYTGYPMVKEARELVKKGSLGKIRKIFVSYRQGWLSRLSEREGNAQAAWRTDASKSGKSGVMGDIGSHAFNLVEFISGLQVTELCAQLNVVVENRALDDDGAVLLKFNNGASGVLIASQVAAGEENNLSISLYGEQGGIEWQQQEPNSLIIKWLDKPMEIRRAGSASLDEQARYFCRTPAGHPEGYLEAFANLYKSFARTLAARMDGVPPEKEAGDFPKAADGIRAMAFIEVVVKSSESSEKWTPYPSV